jgi:alpha-beta hydrolase superfamily lysophospholipase
MQRTLFKDKPATAALLAMAVVTIHLMNASLFHLEAPVSERVAWAAFAVFTMSIAGGVYWSAGNAVRGGIALAIAVPAVIVGIAIHAAHVYELGVEESSFTGIPMLVAGLALIMIGGTQLVRSVHDWWRRLFFAPVALAAVFFLIFPVSLATFATNVPVVPTNTTENPGDRGLAYEDVSFETRQGLTLHAWYVPGTNGAAIITVHGAGSNRSTAMDEAEMLARNGYGVLMVDLEGFGDSDGRANAFGWVGARDIHAATAYLRSRGDVDPERIGGLGLSMGGEVLLQAAGESTDLKAIVAEGATGRTEDDFDELPNSGPMTAIHTIVGIAMKTISGEPAPPPLKDMVQRIAPRNVLLIGANVQEELDMMPMYQRLGGPSFELWLIPEARHVGGFDLHRDEYEQRVIAFFDRSLDIDGGTVAQR